MESQGQGRGSRVDEFWANPETPVTSPETGDPDCRWRQPVGRRSTAITPSRQKDRTGAQQVRLSWPKLPRPAGKPGDDQASLFGRAAEEGGPGGADPRARDNIRRADPMSAWPASLGSSPTPHRAPALLSAERSCGVAG